MFEFTSIDSKVLDLSQRNTSLKAYMLYDEKLERLEEVVGLLEDPDIWNNQDKLQELNKEKQSLEEILQAFKNIDTLLSDVEVLIDIVKTDNDEASYEEILTSLQEAEDIVGNLEFKRMFSGENDSNDCYMDIQSGSGGTEAQDWANMVLRMYLKFADKNGFKTEIVEISDGDVAGIKSATIKIIGNYAYGWFRTETGVHRLVRKSPFDSGNRRHTSFCSAFVYPDIDDKIEIDINPSDLRIDIFRASGAGGQHINKTDSAIRITHLPTNIVVQCQNERSQHANKEQAMKQLRSKLYELELRKKLEEKQALEDSKSDIGWGSQIRSYVLDDARIKDLRTGYEDRNTQAVLDGGLKEFIKESLKAGL
jgi:peptide chain release factor 2